MAIKDFNKINNDYLFSPYDVYNYKFGDLDLLHSGGLMGESIMTFGLFYYEIGKENTSGQTRFYFKTSEILPKPKTIRDNINE